MKTLRDEDEAARLQALHDFDVLDTAAESEFDDFTLLAAQICGTPISLITLVDTDRQWCKSFQGFDLCQIPRHDSFCTHALHQPEVFVVPDAVEDKRFSANPLVTGDPHIRFYAGAPLIAENGYGIGTLCVIDKVPRTLTADQQAALKALSRQVVARLELRRQLIQRTRMERERHASEVLKEAILQSALDCIVTINAQGCVLEWNPAAERTFGYSREEAVKQELAELIVPPSLRAAHRSGMAHYLKTGVGPVLDKRIEITACRANGTVFPVELAITPILLEGKTLFTAYLRDISERKQAEEDLKSAHEELETRVHQRTEALAHMQRQNELLLNSAGEGIYGIDDEGTTQFVNPAGAKMLGYEIHELIGKPMHAHLHHTRRDGSLYPGSDCLIHKSMHQNRVVRDSNEVFWRKDGTAFDVEYISTPLCEDGRIVGAVITFQDITERREAEERILTLNSELVHAYDATIEGWSRALDLRDHETEGHSRRVTEMTLRLARAIGVAQEELVHLRRGALLHDIGKIGVPDSILLKPGPLTAEERSIMSRHPLLAHEMLSPTEFLRAALAIPYSHHEKWDGTGYPKGLIGEDIPLAARLFAMVDVWDALSSDRPYRAAWSQERVLDHLQSLSGTHFDPVLMPIFLKLLEEDSYPSGDFMEGGLPSSLQCRAA